MTELDREQAAAAGAPPGPVLVIAGAGAGKTTTLVHRVQRQCASGAWAAENVLAITHSTKAAGELRVRLQKAGVTGAASRTFHAAALAVCREFWHVTGRDSDGPVLSENNFGIVRDCLRKVGRRDPDTATIADTLAEIGWAKAQLLDASTYPRGRAVADLPEGVMPKILDAYAQALHRAGVVDFSDLLVLGAQVLGDPQASAALASRMRHFLVDEYQDTDPAQQQFLEALLAGRDDVTAVGDPRQSIFSFKGADPALILTFPDRFPGCAVVHLTSNYRSTRRLVEASNRLGPLPGLPAMQAATGQAGEPPVVRAYATEQDECRGVAAAAKRAIAEGVPPREVAVLLRFNAQTAPFEQALTAAGVPYTIVGSDRFFDRSEVVAVLRRAWAVASESPESTAQGAIDRALADAGFDRANPPAGSGAARDRWEAYAVLAAITETTPGGPDGPAKACLSELADRRREAHSATTNAVAISTIHKAKGLEWDVVFLPRAVEGSLPSSYATTADAVAEEHRLAYVAATRARTSLVISWPRQRGNGSRTWPATRSRFLDLIAPQSSADSAPSRPSRRAVPASSSSCRDCGASLPEGVLGLLGACKPHLPAAQAARLDALLSWRADTARRDSAPEFSVMPDRSLAALVAEPPNATHRLAMAGGWGSVRARRYGAAVMDVLARAA